MSKIKKHLWKNRAPWFVMTVLCFLAFVLVLVFTGSQKHGYETVEEMKREEKKARGPPPKDYTPAQNWVPENERPGANVSEEDTGIWKWHNIVRTDPRSLIPDLETMVKDIKNGKAKTEFEFFIKSKPDGLSSVEELIDVLNY